MRNNGGRHRSIYFVLSAISPDGKLVSKDIESKTLDEAIDIFEKEFQFSPVNTSGPFYKKRSRIIVKTDNMSFEKRFKAIYNGWLVDAWVLKNMKNQGYLVFTKRVDGKKIQKPQGKIVVPISELKDT